MNWRCLFLGHRWEHVTYKLDMTAHWVRWRKCERCGALSPAPP